MRVKSISLIFLSFLTAPLTSGGSFAPAIFRRCHLQTITLRTKDRAFRGPGKLSSLGPRARQHRKHGRHRPNPRRQGPGQATDRMDECRDYSTNHKPPFFFLATHGLGRNCCLTHPSFNFPNRIPSDQPKQCRNHAAVNSSPSCFRKFQYCVRRPSSPMENTAFHAIRFVYGCPCDPQAREGRCGRAGGRGTTLTCGLDRAGGSHGT